MRYGDIPASDDDEARKRKIKEFMRTDRPRYFRDELVQQEYRDILERQEAAGAGQAPNLIRSVQNEAPSEIDSTKTSLANSFKKHQGESAIENLPQINTIIEREAKAAGINPRWLKTIAYLESSGNPKKKNGSYEGLFQFDPNDSWKKYGKGGNILDATDSTRAMVRALRSHVVFQTEIWS